MVEDHSTGTNTAIGEEQAQTRLTTNRRRFLKYTVLSGVVGLVDRSLMDRTASATSSTDAGSTEHPASIHDHREQSTDKTLRVTGVGDHINHYHIETRASVITNEESDDSPTIDVTVIEGDVHRDETDGHRIKGRVTTVRTQGSITYSIE